MTLEVGDTVRVSEQVHVTQIGGWGSGLTLYPDQDYEVTRIGTSKVVVRGNRGSGWVGMEMLEGYAPEGYVKPRQLGTPPDDDGEYILPDDPRLRWLWEDAATYVTKEGYCSTYDTICARLGIPGRPRSFNVTGKVGDIDIASSVMAHSPKEAIELVTAKIANLTGVRAS